MNKDILAKKIANREYATQTGEIPGLFDKDRGYLLDGILREFNKRKKK